MSWSTLRVLWLIGTVSVLLGSIDPLEGSVLILIGAAVVTLDAFLAKAPHLKMLVLALLLLVLGIGAMFGLSALGGVGGSSGRSVWWLTVVAPYPVGWVLCLIGIFQTLKHVLRQQAQV